MPIDSDPALGSMRNDWETEFADPAACRVLDSAPTPAPDPITASVTESTATTTLRRFTPPTSTRLGVTNVTGLSLEEPDDLLVAHLAKVAVELADGVARLRRPERHRLGREGGHPPAGAPRPP